MQAITIDQPWASKILDGASGGGLIAINRASTTYRGMVAIHASCNQSYVSANEWPNYAFGAIIGTAKLVDCFNRKSEQRGGIKYVSVNEGWCRVFGKSNRLANPIPCQGSGGLWEFRPKVECSPTLDDFLLQLAAYHNVSGPDVLACMPDWWSPSVFDTQDGREQTRLLVSRKLNINVRRLWFVPNVPDVPELYCKLSAKGA